MEELKQNVGREKLRLTEPAAYDLLLKKEKQEQSRGRGMRR